MVRTNQEMPIFSRTFDLLAWLLPATQNFPRAHRHDFTRRLLDAAFDLREHGRTWRDPSPGEIHPPGEFALRARPRAAVRQPLRG